MLKEQCHEICVPFLGEKLNLGPQDQAETVSHNFSISPCCGVHVVIDKDVLWEH